MIPQDTDVLIRAQGCLLGQLAGDALGSLVEFQPPEQIRREYPDGVRELAAGGTWNTIAGQPTDDSEMALLLARMLAEHGRYDSEEARKAYVFWLNSGGRVGAPRRGDHSSSSGLSAGQRAVHNGDCPAVRTGCDARELYRRIAGWAEDMKVDGSLLGAIQGAAIAAPADYVHQQGWVLTAFRNVLWQLSHAQNLEEAVVNTVMRGGDTDTNAAICGALLGAVYGRDAIPAQWTECLLSCRPAAGQQHVSRPRPECFWPVDAPELAEHLIS